MKVLSFPGIVTEQSNPYVDIVGSGLRGLGVDFSNYNPYKLFQNADVIHLHWLERCYQLKYTRNFPLLSFIVFFILYANVCRIKRKGGVVVITAHNAHPHESAGKHSWVWKFWSKRIYKKIDRVICMTEDAVDYIKTMIPEFREKKFFIAPHPSYIESYQKFSNSNLSLGSLGIPERSVVFGMIGYIKPYKQIDKVVALFDRFSRDDEYLIVAGYCPDTTYQSSIIEAARLNDRIIVISSALTNEEFCSFVRICDVAVFNFSEILNSGSVLAALSLNVPVIAPNKGSLQSIEKAVGEQWMLLFDDELNSDNFRNVLDLSRKAFLEIETRESPDLAFFSPSVVASKHIEAYLAI